MSRQFLRRSNTVTDSRAVCNLFAFWPDYCDVMYCKRFSVDFSV